MFKWLKFWKKKEPKKFDRWVHYKKLSFDGFKISLHTVVESATKEVYYVVVNGVRVTTHRKWYLKKIVKENNHKFEVHGAFHSLQEAKDKAMEESEKLKRQSALNGLGWEDFGCIFVHRLYTQKDFDKEFVFNNVLEPKEKETNK